MFKKLWISMEFLSVGLVETLGEYAAVMYREAGLFLGAGLVLGGILNWSSGKYCDGNTADYLSCTNPTTYYYYGGVEVALVIAGVFLLLLWWLRRRAA